MSKICGKCKRDLPLEFFAPMRRGGHSSICRVCNGIVNAKPAAYKREAGKRWRNANREKARAHAAVQRAIAKGKLVRVSCEVCQDPKSQAHHDDYSKPLEVRWLCHAHHFQAHHGRLPLSSLIGEYEVKAKEPWSAPTEKKCPKCGITKDSAFFGRHASQRDGLFGICKACKNEADRRRYVPAHAAQP